MWTAQLFLFDSFFDLSPGLFFQAALGIMAPRKATTEPGVDAKPATKKSGDRIGKRPTRGYHTFKNGMLNVTPKGNEKDM